MTEDSSGRNLGEHFRGLHIAFSRGRSFEDAKVSNTHYYSQWLIIVPLTLFGGYLLWRDTRCETRIAEMLSQFVSSVSHELKTPLTSIRMVAETRL